MFYGTFSVPRHAASALQSLLPEALVQRIKWDKLRKRSSRFVDPQLTKRYSDLLFEAEIDDETALIYVLYEHKSTPERWTLLQLLEYMVRIWQEFLRERGDSLGKHLPGASRTRREGCLFDAYRVFLEDAGYVPREVTVKALQNVLKLDPAERILFADQYLRASAKQQGKREGKREGVQSILSMLLERRFGPLSVEATQRIQAASQAELKEMALCGCSARRRSMKC